MKFTKATLDTRNFSFECFSETQEHAKELIEKTLLEHFKDYPDQLDRVAHFIDDVQFQEIELGKGYRDRMEII
jgi:hypothetical protein